jgi:anthranilate phosphoribosyltransferase
LSSAVTDTGELAALGGWSALLRRLTRGGSLSRSESAAAMAEILGGSATDAQIAGFIVALRMKGETTEELSGLLDAMLDAGTAVHLDLDLAGLPPVIDVVGSGGDASHSLNVSTLAALTVAGAGGRVCKHGNRSASSLSGSADLLEALGVALDVTPAIVAACVTRVGMGFCFAPRFHPAMRFAGPTRRELGVPTAFNYLGPVANPARVRRLLLGVGDAAMAEPMLDVLVSRGAERAMVVFGDDGMDELTTTTTSTVLELADGQRRRWTLDPAQLGLAPATREALAVSGPQDSAAAARRVLAGERGPHRDIVALNAAGALVVSGQAASVEEGLGLAARSLDSGRAADVLDGLVRVSNGG